MTDIRPRSPGELVGVIRRRWWVVFLAVILTVMAAVGFGLHQTVLYQASAQALLNQQPFTIPALGGSSIPAGDVQARNAATAAQIAETPRVAAMTLKAARVTGITPTQLLARSSASADPASNIITLSVTDHTRARAIALANAYGSQFVARSQQLAEAGLTQTLARANLRIAAIRREILANPGSTVLRGELNGLITARQQLQEVLSLQVNEATMARPAQSAEHIQPNIPRDAAIGAALGLVLGVGLTFFLEAFDSRVRSTDEVGSWLSLPLLGRLPTPNPSKNGVAMIADPAGASAEPFRELRVAFDFANVDVHAKVVIVTSPFEQEGKSTTIANLAVAFARAGRRTALVDLDLRRPTLGTLLQLGEPPGLTEVVLGNASLDSALVIVPLGDVASPAAHTNGDGAGTSSGGATPQTMLHVLTAGFQRGDPSTILEGKALGAVLERLRERADVVLLDCPPLIGLSDSVTIAQHADATVVVVRANTVTRGALLEARRLLDICRLPALGFVLTGAESSSRYGYGAYGSAQRLTQAPSTVESRRSASV